MKPFDTYFKTIIIKASYNHSYYKQGWGNGYVSIPKGHILYKKKYDEIHLMFPEINVHGGLTYSDFVEKGSVFEKNGFKEGDYIIGFDTGHFGDNIDNWSKKQVFAETESLKNQILNKYPFTITISDLIKKLK